MMPKARTIRRLKEKPRKALMLLRKELTPPNESSQPLVDNFYGSLCFARCVIFALSTRSTIGVA